ncbi:hypothetical protein P3342_013179 [Pyrenophora teres f. teres]|nr:hypothetical protein P3342_013179 [Pyrenophora teres f. teres]
MLNTPRAWSLLEYAEQSPVLTNPVTESSNTVEDAERVDELRRLAERKAIDRDYIDYVIAGNFDRLTQTGDKRVSERSCLR